MSESLELFIAVDESGNPIGHPIVKENLLQAFPNIDLSNLPSNFERFVRTPRPELGIYEVMAKEYPTYEKINGVFTDVWHIADMPLEQKAAKQQNAKDAWFARPNRHMFSTWYFDEATCEFQPPVPFPTDTRYYWCGAENNWKLRPEYPTDGKQYRFKYSTWQWVEV